MAGPLFVGQPSEAGHAASKGYVDAFLQAQYERWRPSVENQFNLSGQPGFFYGHFGPGLLWSEADRVCEQGGGQMFPLSNRSELMAVVEFLKKSVSLSRFWVAGRNFAADAPCQQANYKRVCYTPYCDRSLHGTEIPSEFDWADKEPTCVWRNYSESVLQIYSEGKLNDMSESLVLESNSPLTLCKYELS